MFPIRLINKYREVYIAAQAEKDERGPNTRLMERLEKKYHGIKSVAMSESYIQWLKDQGWPTKIVEITTSTSPKEQQQQQFQYRTSEEIFRDLNIPFDIPEPEPPPPPIDPEKLFVRLRREDRVSYWYLVGFFLVLTIGIAVIFFS